MSIDCQDLELMFSQEQDYMYLENTKCCSKDKDSFFQKLTNGLRK